MSEQKSLQQLLNQKVAGKNEKCATDADCKLGVKQRMDVKMDGRKMQIDAAKTAEASVRAQEVSCSRVALCDEEMKNAPYLTLAERRQVREDKLAEEKEAKLHQNLQRQECKRPYRINNLMPSMEEREKLRANAIKEEAQKKKRKQEDDQEKNEIRWKLIGKELEDMSLKISSDRESSSGRVCDRGIDLVRNVKENLSKMKVAIGPVAGKTVFRNTGKLAAALLGVAESTVAAHVDGLRIGKKKKVAETRKRCRERAAAKLSAHDKQKIFEFLQSSWKNNEHVTLNRILEWAKRTIRYNYGKSSLGYALGGMGLCFKQKSHNPVIEERKDIIFLRSRFLEKMEEARKMNGYISYFDETWLFQGMVLNKGWQVRWGTPYERARMACVEMPLPGPKKGKNKGKRGIVVAVITEDGVMPGTAQVWISGGRVDEQTEDYHTDMDADQYEQYMIQDVLPELVRTAARLNRPPILVIDNASYHCRTIEKAPTSASRVNELKAFLDTYRVPYGARERKPDLYRKVRNVIAALGGRSVLRKYALDEHAKSLGVEVIRLPPYHCFLNPIELLWSQVKQHVRTVGSTSSTLEEIRIEALTFMGNFSAEASQKLFRHVEKAEIDIRSLVAAKEAEYEEIINERMRAGVDESDDGSDDDDFLDQLSDEDSNIVCEPSTSIFEAASACFAVADTYGTEACEECFVDMQERMFTAGRMLLSFSSGMGSD